MTAIIIIAIISIYILGFGFTVEALDDMGARYISKLWKKILLFIVLLVFSPILMLIKSGSDIYTRN